VTSPTGAAIRDVLHVIQRRHPGLELILAPCRVQGDGAAAEIAEAIRLLNEFNSELGTRNLELILVTRGGGSLEVVARAIFESELPVVSAVGHEIDFTIADFVADVRAATPSAAAEIITEGVYSCRTFVAGAWETMSFCARRRLEQDREDFASLTQRLLRTHPRRRVEEQAQRLDDLLAARCVKQGARERRVEAQTLTSRLMRVRPSQRVRQSAEGLSQALRQLAERGRHQLANARSRFATEQARLRLLGPEQVLSRGYSITMDAATGEILRDARQVRAGQGLRTRLKCGEIESRVEPKE
jgi:exodeoxyribonuclease VII large subunit